MEQRKIRRGDIYYANLGRYEGNLQGGTRPVIIIQTDWLNATSTLFRAVAVTSQEKRTELPTHYMLPMVKGLPKRSMVIGEHHFMLSRQDLIEYRCTLDAKTMKMVDRCVRSSARGNYRKRKFK